MNHPGSSHISVCRRDSVSSNHTFLSFAFGNPWRPFRSIFWSALLSLHVTFSLSFELLNCRRLANAPWYVTNDTLRRDLKIPTIYEEITQHSITYQERLAKHPNPSAINLVDNSDEEHRLKRYHILELPFRFNNPHDEL